MPDSDDLLKRSLRRVLSAVEPPVLFEAVALEPLPGGVARRSYLASAGDRRFIVRSAPQAVPGALDVEAEGDVMREAAELGAAPDVIGCDAEAGILVTEYRAGADPWTADLARDPGNIARIADILRRLHTVRGEARKFDPMDFAHRYLASVSGSSLRPPQRRLAAEFEALAAHYAARYPSIALCHNDLAASNVLDDGRLWLIDFEYAVTAAPVLDLANLAAMNDFGSGERRQLTEAYYCGRAAPFSDVELERVVRLVDLMAYFWALSAARQRGDDSGGPYGVFAQEMAEKLV